jgi:hypothetical protein
MDTRIFWDKLSTKQRQIASDRRSAAARKDPGESLKSVAHHIDVEWMYGGGPEKASRAGLRQSWDQAGKRSAGAPQADSPAKPGSILYKYT